MPKRDQTANILQNLDPSIPTRMLSPDDPKTKPPVLPPEGRRPNKLKNIDPFEVAKRDYAVNIFEALRWRVPTELQGEIIQNDKANFYLIFDKCFRMLVKGDFKHWGLKRMKGELQSMYLWFYWESYGRGYNVCPLGQTELVQLLGWSRNRVKRVLDQLLEYGKPAMGTGIVSALEQFPPFEFSRAQVYRVYLPREFLEMRWRVLNEEARRQSGLEGLKQLRSLFERDEGAKEILPMLDESLPPDNLPDRQALS